MARRWYVLKEKTRLRSQDQSFDDESLESVLSVLLDLNGDDYRIFIWCKPNDANEVKEAWPSEVYYDHRIHFHNESVKSVKSQFFGLIGDRDCVIVERTMLPELLGKNKDQKKKPPIVTDDEDDEEEQIMEEMSPERRHILSMVQSHTERLKEAADDPYLGNAGMWAAKAKAIEEQLAFNKKLLVILNNEVPD
jgi:hypothetical protein